MIYLVRSAAGARHPIPLAAGSELVLGRSPDCDIVIDDASVSRRHLRLLVQNGSVEVADLDSANGLWVDAKRVPRARLEFGRWFAAGNVLLAVRQGINFGSRSSTGVTQPAVTSTTVTPLVAALTGAPTDRPSEDYAQQLLHALLAVDGPGRPRLDVVLQAVVRCEQLRGAEILAPHGSRWVSLASTGRPFPDECAALEPVSGNPVGLRDRAVPAVTDILRTVQGRILRRTVLRDGRLRALLLAWIADDATSVVGFDVVEGLIATESIELGDDLTRAADPTSPDAAGFITASESGHKLLSELDRLAATSLPVLIQGESGAGKDLLAHRLHRRSKRASKPFVALNCAAIPRDLVEAELFGIEKGIATGVGERTGHFVQASGGTLFLDEVGDLPLDLQPKLMRALQNGEVLPVGASKPLKVDVRVVAATNIDLREAVREKLFRQDLLYRLAGAEVRVPPLRERPEDILPLARHFAREAAKSSSGRFLGIDVDAATALIGYSWPGNVRELQHVIARAVALADGPILHEELLPADINGSADRTLGGALLGLREDWRGASDAFARLYFTQLIERCNGNMTEAARAAGLGRSTLYAKLAELGMRPGRESDPP